VWEITRPAEDPVSFSARILFPGVSQDTALALSTPQECSGANLFPFPAAQSHKGDDKQCSQHAERMKSNGSNSHDFPINMLKSPFALYEYNRTLVCRLVPEFPVIFTFRGFSMPKRSMTVTSQDVLQRRAQNGGMCGGQQHRRHLLAISQTTLFYGCFNFSIQ
jgi:hypothetical protein